MTDSTSDRFALVGTTLDGRFRVDRVVAEGGFGVVYEATQVTLDRRVALKVLKTPPRLDAHGEMLFVEKFAGEAKTIARMAHASIVQVYDFGVSKMPNEKTAAWMALEWLTGHTLETDLHERRGSVGRSPKECLSLMKPVMEAIAYAHQRAIAHRDLKPANIMVLETDAGLALKVLDFGIAKVMENDEEAVGPTRTPPTLIAYSPGYAASEQIAHGRTGPWTDVHALALILVEMLTNQPPFTATELSELFFQIVDSTRPTPRLRGVDVGPWEAILARALSVTPGERHANAGELLRALEANVPHAASRASSTVATAPTLPAPSRAAPAALAALGAAPVPPGTTAAPVSHDERPIIPKQGAPVALYVTGAAALAIAATFGFGVMKKQAQTPSYEATALVAAPATTDAPPALSARLEPAALGEPDASTSAHDDPARRAPSRLPARPVQPRSPAALPSTSARRPVPVE